MLVEVPERNVVDAGQIERPRSYIGSLPMVSSRSAPIRPPEQVGVADDDRRQARVQRLRVGEQLGAVQVDHRLVQLGDGAVLEFGLGQRHAAQRPGKGEHLDRPDAGSDGVRMPTVRATVTWGTSSARKMSTLVARPGDSGMSWLPAAMNTGTPASTRRRMRRANSRWWVALGSRVL